MKPQRLLAFILAFILCGHTALRAQDLDTELSKLTESLAAQIKDKGNKKVTVLDFTDLDGNASELGKYLAEQLTVNFVMAKRDFAVLDRANLKKIMDEHKLTASGLVDPENAKKLGMFAGVDAMLFGTIVSIGTNTVATVKIITTDTAEVVGGGKAKFQQDSNIQQLVAKPAKADDVTAAKADATSSSTTDAPPAPIKPRIITPDMKPFGDLQVNVESLRISNSGNYGNAKLTLIITNTSPTDTYGVAFNSDLLHNASLSNDRSDEFQVLEASGVETGYTSDYNHSFSGSFTDIPPNTSITVVTKSQILWNGRGKPGDYRPYRFQTVVFFSTESQGRYSNVRKYNLIKDIN